MHPYIPKLLKNKVFRKYPVTSTEEVRTKLPHLIDPKHKPSIIKLIKDLVGKDITRVALPAYMNEPLSML
jgi:oxysterol-binding protein 1